MRRRQGTRYDIRRVAVVCLLLSAVTISVYWPLGKNEFLTYDDAEYVTDNMHVREGLTGENIGWAFTHMHSANWDPLTWISHMVDCQLFGLNPLAHHLTNLLLHIANSV